MRDGKEFVQDNSKEVKRLYEVGRETIIYRVFFFFSPLHVTIIIPLFQIVVYDYMRLFYFHNYILYKIREFCGVFSIFLERVLWICFPYVCVCSRN